MEIKSLFEKDIYRDINGVVKVDQEKEDIVFQELDEFVITKELRSHINTFYSAYKESLHKHKDDMGVWISGFFGSGKSHFLKILSYLLENKNVKGKLSVDYLDDPRSSIVDALSTMVIDDTQVKVYAWYDNEWGYVNRMMDIAVMIARSL